jgi:hypothetical protein
MKVRLAGIKVPVSLFHLVRRIRVRLLIRLLLGAPVSTPEVFPCACALGGVELLEALVRELQWHLFDFRHLDLPHLVPWIDEAAVNEKAGFGPALDERLDLSFDILLMLDGQQVKGFSADQESAQLRDDQDLGVVAG